LFARERRDPDEKYPLFSDRLGDMPVIHHVF
jgi:hypothetical protein